MSFDLDRNCPIEGCNRKVTSSGACKHHAAVWKRSHTSDGRRTSRALKLTPGQCAEARQLSSRFVAPVDIAKRFGVSRSTIDRVLAGTYEPGHRKAS